MRDQRNWRVTVRKSLGRGYDQRQRVVKYEVSAFHRAGQLARQLRCEVEVCLLRPSFMVWIVKPDGTVSASTPTPPYPEDRARWNEVAENARKWLRRHGANGS